MKKAELKQKKQARTMKLLKMCKAHQSPVTLSNIGILDHLAEGELLSEIGYLWVTAVPDISQM